MSDKAVTPIEKKRMALLKDMTPATRKVALEFHTIHGKIANGMIMAQYDIGARIAEIVENEGEYGSGAIKQLAAFLNVRGGETALYALKGFAESFDKAYVREWSSRPMANGEFLAIGHWHRLQLLKDRKSQDKMLERIFSESLTVNELEKEIRAMGSKDKRNSRTGGRKPAVPTSPIAGLQTAFQIANKWANLEPVLEANVFDAIDELPPDRINDALLDKLNETKTKLDEMVTKAQAASERVTTNIERVENVLALKNKAEDSEEAEEEEEEEKPEKPAKSAKPAVKNKKKKKKVAAS